MNCEKLWYHVDGIQYFDRYTRADIEIFILELISFKVEQVQLMSLIVKYSLLELEFEGVFLNVQTWFECIILPQT